MSVEMKLEGIDNLTDRLTEMGAKANKAMKDALEDGAEPILQDARNTTVFKDRTGNLRESLKKSKVKTTKKGAMIWVGDVERKCSYSWIVEYGHSKATAKPFLRPAYSKNKEQAKEIIKEKLREGLKM